MPVVLRAAHGDDEFEKVYRSIIDKFVQKKYTRKERKAQADAGYLYCITDESASIYVGFLMLPKKSVISNY